MASFQDSGSARPQVRQQVGQQVGQQVVHGSIYYNHIANDAGTSEQQGADPHGLVSLWYLDNEILQSLSFPEMTDRRRNIAAPHRQTCRWIFEVDQYKDWKASSAGLLWIKGKPGAGKSTLMSQLYDEAGNEHATSSSNRICLEFFFTARGVPLERSFLGMLRSLTNQIFNCNDVDRDQIRESYQSRQASFGNANRVWQWQQSELEQLFTLTVVNAAKRQPIIIFIDALDEAGKQTAKEIAKFFHGLNDVVLERSLSVKICISCRHYPVPSQFPATEICVEQYNNDDIAAYVRHHFRPFLQNDQSQREGWRLLMHEVVDTAQGVFQWVHLVLPMVDDWISEGDSLEQVRKYLLRVPAELSHVYEYILTKLIDPRHRKNSLRLFQWVCMALRPQPVSALRYALAAGDILADPLPRSMCSDTPFFAADSRTMILRIKSWSGGLIEVVKDGERTEPLAQTIHKSVNDFMQRNGLLLLTELNSKHPYQHINTAVASGLDAERLIAAAHGEIYWACLCFAATEHYKYKMGSQTPLSERDELYPHGVSSLSAYLDNGLIVHARMAQSCRARNLRQEFELLQHILPSLVNESEEWGSLGWRKGVTPLHFAATAGLIDLAHYIQKHREDVHAVDEGRRTALHFATWHGHLAMVKLLVQMGIDIQSETLSNETPLTIAVLARQTEIFSWLVEEIRRQGSPFTGLERTLLTAVSIGSIKMVEFCISAGVDVNASEGDNVSLSGGDDVDAYECAKGGTALIEACRHGNMKIVQLLLDAGCDVNVQDCRGNRALHMASQKQRPDLVRVLLGAGAGVNARIGGDRDATALQVASRENSTAVVQVLLDHGADVNARGGKMYGSALHEACLEKESGRLAKLLLESGADVNIQGGTHGNPLQAVCCWGSMAAMKKLLENGANINAPGGRYGSALQAAVANGHETVTRLLLDRGADVNAQGGRHGSALQAAVANGHVILTRLLLDKEADIEVQGGLHGNLLQAACHSGSMTMIELLLRDGADINGSGGYYGSALQAAAANGHETITRLLLDRGADINAQGGLFGSALQAAAAHGHETTIRLLLDRGADIHAQGGRHGSALQAAIANGHDTLTRLLLDRGANINTFKVRHGSDLQAVIDTGSSVKRLFWDFNETKFDDYLRSGQSHSTVDRYRGNPHPGQVSD